MPRHARIARTAGAAAGALAVSTAMLSGAPTEGQQAWLVARSVLPAVTSRAGSHAFYVGISQAF